MCVMMDAPKPHCIGWGAIQPPLLPASASQAKKLASQLSGRAGNIGNNGPELLE
jgi:hypothetical protein